MKKLLALALVVMMESMALAALLSPAAAAPALPGSEDLSPPLLPEGTTPDPPRVSTPPASDPSRPSPLLPSDGGEPTVGPYSQDKPFVPQRSYVVPGSTANADLFTPGGTKTKVPAGASDTSPSISKRARPRWTR